MIFWYQRTSELHKPLSHHQINYYYFIIIILLNKLKKKSFESLDVKIKDALRKRIKKHVSQSPIKEVRKVFLKKLKKENGRREAATSDSSSVQYGAEEMEQSQSGTMKIGVPSSSRSPRYLKKAKKIRK